MAANFKTPAWRSKKYLDWVKTLPCCVCNAHADDAHHLKGLGHLSGVGLTAPDPYVMPMCRTHHNWIHANPTEWPKQWEWALRTLAKAVSEGVFKC